MFSTSEVVDILTDLPSATATIVDSALEVTASRMHLETQDETVARIVAGDAASITYFRFELARRVARLLLSSDTGILAVYEEQEVPESEELSAPVVALADPQRLYIHVNRATASVNALISIIAQRLAAATQERLRIPVNPWICAILVERDEQVLEKPRAFGYRPAPLLLARRGVEI